MKRIWKKTLSVLLVFALLAGGLSVPVNVLAEVVSPEDVSDDVTIFESFYNPDRNWQHMGTLLQGKAETESGEPISGVIFEWVSPDTVNGTALSEVQYREDGMEVVAWDADYALGWYMYKWLTMETDENGTANMYGPDFDLRDENVEASCANVFLTVRPKVELYLPTYENQIPVYAKWAEKQEEFGIDVYAEGKKVGHVTLYAYPEQEEDLEKYYRNEHLPYRIGYRVDFAAEGWEFFGEDTKAEKVEKFATNPVTGEDLGDILVYCGKIALESMVSDSEKAIFDLDFDGLYQIKAVYKGQNSSMEPAENPYTVDLLERENAVLSLTEAEELQKINQTQPIVIQTNEGVSFKFQQGDFQLVEGTTEYDFGVKLNKEYNGPVWWSSEQKFIFEIEYNYEGQLPGTAEVRIPVGKAYDGHMIYYYDDMGNVIDRNMAWDGYVTVSMDHCSNYFLSSQGAGKEQVPEEPEEGTGNKTDTPEKDTNNKTDTPMPSSSPSNMPVNNINSGKANDKVNGEISPKKVVIKSLKALKGRKLKVSWSKNTAAGYEVQYSLKKNFKGAKKVTVKGNKKNYVTIKKLKKGKKYYVRVRAYNMNGKKKLYGAYSKVKKVKIKK